MVVALAIIIRTTLYNALLLLNLCPYLGGSEHAMRDPMYNSLDFSGSRGGEASALAGGAVTLSLASSADPQALPVGQTVSFQVQLSGLTGGQALDSLSAVVHYTNSLLGSPLVAKGEIVPEPLSDPYDFITYEDVGVADATFATDSAEPAHHVDAEGVFFRFDVEVLDVGAGQLWFDYVDASEFNPAAPGSPVFFTPATGPALSVQAVTVPEPAAWVLLATAALAVVLYFLKKSPLSLWERGRG